MPEGPFGLPRLTNFGPLSRSTKEELKSEWPDCPPSGKPSEICRSYKFHSVIILEDQDFFAECDTLRSINQGNCFNIARMVEKDVGGVRILQIGDGEHAWIKYNGVHYDAEAPDGVDDWQELPIFLRISPFAMLRNAKMAAKVEDREEPETIEDTLVDITEGKT